MFPELVVDSELGTQAEGRFQPCLLDLGLRKFCFEVKQENAGVVH